ncbi:MAG: hypothetical protein AAGI90_02995 [Chlamydiota bacterium]
MEIGVVGVNFKTTPLALRESLIKSLHYIEKEPFASLLLATCNRVEVYFSGKDLVRIHSRLLGHIQKFIPLEHLYSYFSKDCFLHLAKVASGLDSACLFESDIQRQIRGAYAYAIQSKKLPSALHFTFQKALHVAKRLRSQMPASEKRSLEGALWEFSQRFFPDLIGRKVLFIGFSKTNRKTCAYYARKGVETIGFSSKSEEAKAFCLEKNMTFVPWNVAQLYRDFDVLIVATDRQELLLQGFSRRAKTLLIDVSVPRVIPSNLKTDRVELLDINDVDRAFLAQKETDQSKKIVCERLVEAHVQRIVTIKDLQTIGELQRNPRKRATKARS